ncbi:hypothetical protein [Aquimarina algiphila]|uniref:hypothetical protein n=1 Tax=Aquimarina algiphila TaxID=2047982 RepID=UPI00232E05A0|nr:hypothetical protein [Aquimarina algiphila]
MKNYIIISLIILLSGCGRSKKKSIEIEKKDETNILYIANKTNINSKEIIESNIEEHTCWASGSIIKEGFYVSYISKNRDECNIGKSKVILEKVIGHKSSGQAIFEKIDEINVEKQNEKTTFSKITLKINSKSKEQDYVIKFYDGRTETISKIYDIWKVDYESMMFKKINIPENLTFDNPDWME